MIYEVVYFIGDKTDITSKLQALRSNLIENSKDLLSLFRKRMIIAKEIGEVKKSGEAKIRNRPQELKVLETLGISDPIEERFLNLLFELTILSESLVGDSFECDSGRNTDKLQEILAATICSPGDKLFMPSYVDIPFVKGAVMMGAHVIEESCDSFDLWISIRYQGKSSSLTISKGNQNNEDARPDSLRLPKRIMIEVQE